MTREKKWVGPIEVFVKVVVLSMAMIYKLNTLIIMRICIK